MLRGRSWDLRLGQYVGRKLPAYGSQVCGEIMVIIFWSYNTSYDIMRYGHRHIAFQNLNRYYSRKMLKYIS